MSNPQQILEGYEPIEDYGVIGNLHTMALVSKRGSIDYLPFMRIDSPTVFLRLLDTEKGGYFSIEPQSELLFSKQFYLTHTNLLVTRFHTAAGIVEVTDFMPVSQHEFQCAVVRCVKAVIGKVPMRMRCVPRFDYARSDHRIQLENEGCLFVPLETDRSPVRLSSNRIINTDSEKAFAEFTLDEGDSCYFLLEAEHTTRERRPDTAEHVKQVYESTYHFWKSWTAKVKYDGLWKEDVLRSALVLKLLVSQTYGSPVAAATFGLPEAIGGERNWDYRYTWIRDAALTMYVFMKLGLHDEADHFIEWIKVQCTKDGLQLMYAVDGTKELTETVLDHLEGYRNSKPVRIGNGAYDQLQLDIFGELLDTVHIFVRNARIITPEFWETITRQVDFVMANWKRPDHSIWEIRGGVQEFLFSRLMCWLALDRALKIAEKCSFPYPEEKWRGVRDEIYQDIYTNFWNDEIKSFVQYKGGDKVDASMLMMPIVGFISPYSEYWHHTLSQIEEKLVRDVMVYRYLDEDKMFDNLQGSEGSFTICSFWYVQALTMGGEIEKAMRIFEKLLGFGNHLGLYAEEIGQNGRHLGNFPQAFTHLSLISAAIQLSKRDHLRKKVVPPSDVKIM